ncbi:MAG: hypothetical protein JSR59_21260 [Proteobacteria bacterium]|nr:hypothetical protein [Pseudomonadota bacterium]
MNLTALPAFGDYRIRILDDGRRAIAADPRVEALLPAALAAGRHALRSILVTHHRPAAALLRALRPWKPPFR